MITQQLVIASVSHKLDRMVSVISVEKVNKNANDLIGFRLSLDLHASHLIEIIVYPMTEPRNSVDVVLRQL